MAKLEYMRDKEGKFNGKMKLLSLTSDEIAEIQKTKFYKVPDNVVAIGRGAFMSCRALEEIDLNNVVALDNFAFTGCENLNKIDCSRLKVVGGNVFRDCDSIEELYLENLELAGEEAFSGCNNVTKIDMPNLQYLGDNAFEDCASLKEIVLPGEQFTGISCKLNKAEQRSFGQLDKLTLQSSSGIRYQFHAIKDIQYFGVLTNKNVVAYDFANPDRIIMPAGMWNEEETVLDL